MVPILAGLLGIAAALSALKTSRDVHLVETRWEDEAGVRETLLEAAGMQLEATLAAAVGLVRDLAEEGAGVANLPRAEAFGRLGRAATNGPERGVVVFDGRGQPWAWGGRQRALLSPAGPEFGVDISPFYVSLEARRQGPGVTAAARVLLDVHDAVPDRASSVAARFRKMVGSDLEFYLPGHAPFDDDVFDYCIPACGVTDVVPDTLFSVRIVPPSQGARKLEREARGRRAVAFMALALAGLLAIAGSGAARAAALVITGGLLVLTPAGQTLIPGSLFTPDTYYSGILGPLSGSAAALLVAGILGWVGAIHLWRSVPLGKVTGIVIALVLLVLTPILVHALSVGITVPVVGAGISLWVQWYLALTFVGAALLFGAAGALRASVRGISAWVPWIAATGSVGAAALGLAGWVPNGNTSAWVLALWAPILLVAVRSGTILRTFVAVSVVSGAGAAQLTWIAVTEGRMRLAERDAAALRRGADPVAVALLDRLAGEAEEWGPPTTSGELFALWSRSPLATDGYPVVLAVWSAAGELVSRLELADLDIPSSLLYPASAVPIEPGTPVITEIQRPPGTYYLLSLKYDDGSAFTAGLGPPSRVIMPLRIARFLSGEPGLPAPYEAYLTDPVVEPLGTDPEGVEWQRVGWRLLGDERIPLPDGTRHLHLVVDLGAFGALAVRGMLLLVLSTTLLGVLWFVSEGLSGRIKLSPGALEALSLKSYRARLGIVLAVFFVVPTVMFASWTAGRLRAEAQRSRDLVASQALREAAETVRERGIQARQLSPDLVDQMGSRYRADLLLYEGGSLRHASASILAELGLVDFYLSPSVHLRLLEHEESGVALDMRLAGRATRVSYRAVGTAGVPGPVLASPRLVEDPDLLKSEQDLIFGLLLATLLGFGAAAWLATIAVRSLARPVAVLRDAAMQVGRGEAPRALASPVPAEFVPVADAFRRMASDIASSRQALEAQRRRTADVLRNVATGVVAVDDDLQVVIANPRAEELLDVSLPAGSPLVELASDWRGVWNWVADSAAGGVDPEPREFVLRDREVRIQAVRLRGSGGGWVIALDDTTELSRAVRVLAWGELARQIAHEIKNPLTPIRLGIQHLQRAHRDPRGDFSEVLDRTGRQILAEIERLDAIARAFSRFGAPPAGTEPMAEVDVVEVSRDAAALYALGEGTRVAVESEGPASGRARRDELKEVLINLVENARNAGAGSITIAINGSRDGGASVSVTDDGSGIPPEHLGRIFDPRFSTTTSGSGLGLAICRRLVESWGGSINATSRVGGPTTVTFTVPA